MFWKIDYEFNGQKDVLFFGRATSKEEKNRRISKMKRLGFKVLSCNQVKTLT